MRYILDQVKHLKWTFLRKNYFANYIYKKAIVYDSMGTKYASDFL